MTVVRLWCLWTVLGVHCGVLGDHWCFCEVLAVTVVSVVPLMLLVSIGVSVRCCSDHSVCSAWAAALVSLVSVGVSVFL